MSRSDGTLRYSLRTPGEKQAFSGRGANFRRDYARPLTKAARRGNRMVLHAGREPEPSRHRHGALWDRF
jgi:hypothetical protein